MSDNRNVDNSSIVSSAVSSKIDRWTWLKNIPNKILRRSPVSAGQVNHPEGISKEFLPTNISSTLSDTEEPEPEKKHTTKLEQRAETPSTTVNEEPEEVPVATRTSNINRILQDELAKLIMNVPEIETRGVPAIIGTNETVGNGFFEAIQAKHPDGYLIGVGSGSAYSMLHVFEDEVTPKGMVLADIDPRVVATGRLLIQNLKESATSADFQRKFFNISEETFNQKLQSMIAAEQDPALKRRWEAVNADAWHKVWTNLSEREPFEWKNIRAYKYEGYNIDVVGAILAKFDVLKQLADEDNITMAYADFTNPDFIEAVRKLPGLENATNVIYFSNIIDHITQRGTKMENVSAINSLKAYENYTHPAIFIDTLGQGLNYFLRARNSLAEFSRLDFLLMGIQPRSQKPEGLLFTG